MIDGKRHGRFEMGEWFCMGFIIVITSPAIFRQITDWPPDRATVLFRA
jgi:hypothetical protein